MTGFLLLPALYRLESSTMKQEGGGQTQIQRLTINMKKCFTER